MHGTRQSIEDIMTVLQKHLPHEQAKWGPIFSDGLTSVWVTVPFSGAYIENLRLRGLLYRNKIPILKSYTVFDSGVFKVLYSGGFSNCEYEITCEQLPLLSVPRGGTVRLKVHEWTNMPDIAPFVTLLDIVREYVS